MSIAPAFAKDTTITRDYLYFNHNHNRAIRVGDTKLIATGDDGPWELYNLATDRSEQKNLASAHPDRVKQLSAKWQACEDEFARARDKAPECTKELMGRGRAAKKKA